MFTPLLTHFLFAPAACCAISACSYLFVEDVAEAFDMVLHKGDIGEVYNIGTEKERSVLDVSDGSDTEHCL
jgi:hypothetical protein